MNNRRPHSVDPHAGPGSAGAQPRPQPVEEHRPPGGSESSPALAPNHSAPSEPGAAGSEGAEGAELARQALARAKAEARERGAVPKGAPRRHRRGRLRSRNEPQLFGEAVRTWLIDHGWQEQVAIGGVFGRWADIVGDFNAEHLRPESYSEGELVVVADSPTMAAHARAMVHELMRRLNEELGDGTVVTVQVRGPGSRRR